MVELEGEAFELASRASELLENFDPLTAARVGNSRGGELFVYLQSEASKIDLISLADPSEPLMCIGGALVHYLLLVEHTAFLRWFQDLINCPRGSRPPRTDQGLASVGRPALDGL